jgi:hypothetical protein
MKLQALNNPRFFQALNKLLMADLPMKMAFRLKKEALRLEEENKRFEDMRKVIVEGLVEKDEDDKIKLGEDGNYLFGEGKEAEAVSKINELLDVDIECSKFSIDAFGDATISALDLIVLSDLIED